MPHRTHTTRTTLLAVLIVPALAGGTVPALGQSASRTPTAGDWSVSLAVLEPDEDLGFGVHRMLTDRLNLGLEVDFEWARTDASVAQDDVRSEGEARVWSLLVGPVLRWYGRSAGPVSPYLRLHAAMGKGRDRGIVDGNVQDDSEFTMLLVSLGLGAEWYPIRQLGIGGHTGFEVTREQQELDPPNGLHFEYDTWTVRAFRSGIRASLYFH